MSSNLKYGTGRGKYVGQSVIYPIPIPLDPKQHFGAVVCASDGQLYYSDGDLWVIPVDTSDISRPQAIEPITADDATRLTLTTFRSSRGYDQVGILFHISTAGGASFTDFVTRTVDSPVDNFYQILDPEDGFSPGDEIWWRAKYIGTNNTQSAFSLPYKQIFPNLIETPQPVTGELQIVGSVEITPFDVAYNYVYVETQFEFYNETGDTLLKTVMTTTPPGNKLNVPLDLSPGTIYQFRARYGARAGLGSPTDYSEWSQKRKYINGSRSIILEYDLLKSIDNTIGVPLGDSGLANGTINWGDGSIEIFTSGGVKRHTYAPGFTGIATVTISGSLQRYGNSSVTGNDQRALIRVNSFGYQMGLVSLQNAFRNTSINLAYITPDIPPEITDMSNAFYGSATIADLRNLNLTNVTNMSWMFAYLIGSGPLIDGWDLPNVTNMQHMFYYALTFNRPIGNWKLYKVTSMSNMFYYAKEFNQPIGNWNVSTVTNMTWMFSNALVFNQPIGNWNVSNVTSMSYMFYFAKEFNQPIGDWDVSNVTNMSNMFSQARFRGDISNWDVSNVLYMSYMFNNNGYFNGDISNWNTSNVRSMSHMFYSSNSNPDVSNWDVSNVTDMSRMFAFTRFFNRDISGWNVSNVRDMNWMFTFAESFNQPIGNWDVSNVTNMERMFYYAKAFNQPIGNWNMTNVTNRTQILSYATAFDQDISKWYLDKNTVIDSNSIWNSNLSSINYSKLLAGWANTIAQTDGPDNVSLFGSSFRYSNLIVFNDGRFKTAVEGRAFLTNPRSYQITNADNSIANGIYVYSAELQVYINSDTGWFLSNVAFAQNQSEWKLQNEVGDIMSTGTGSSPMAISNWTNALENAVVIKYGAGWTISGDSPL